MICLFVCQRVGHGRRRIQHTGAYYFSGSIMNVVEYSTRPDRFHFPMTPCHRSSPQARVPVAAKSWWYLAPDRALHRLSHRLVPTSSQRASNDRHMSTQRPSSNVTANPCGCGREDWNSERTPRHRPLCNVHNPRASTPSHAPARSHHSSRRLCAPPALPR